MSQTPDGNTPLTQTQRALMALEKMQAKLTAVEKARTEPIAVIGLGCRFPGGATDADSFWTLLHDGVDATREVPLERWDADALYDPDPDVVGRMITRRGAFLDQVDRFDPFFFGLAPREALYMDPQQRLLLEVAWEALEDAGQAPDRLEGSATGVFVGVGYNDYSLLTHARRPDDLNVYFGTGNTTSVAAGRLSYVLGLQGPAMVIDTACSSALVAVHLAAQSLRSGECRMALAGAVNLILSPQSTIIFSNARMISPDGRCKTFDASADGFGRGEGCGVVVLKRLSDAQADGDRILAVIRGTAVNQDGRSSGLTAPNGPAQEAVIRQALLEAKVDPAHIAYLEAHGTGTSLGDPIEVMAASAVLGRGRGPDQPLYLGSVKTNMGHLEAAAGIVGLIKAVLSLQHRTIPPHLHFHRPSPHIPWDRAPLKVPTTLHPFPSYGPRRLAAVSSFGISGTNAHAILEEAPDPVSDAPGAHTGVSASKAPSAHTQDSASKGPGPNALSVDSGSNAPSARSDAHLLLLSARSEAALTALCGRYSAYLRVHPELDPADICHTARVGRAHFSHRLALVLRTGQEAIRALDNVDAQVLPPGVHRGIAGAEPPRIAFLFSGQGAHYDGLARGLFAAEPVFRAALEECAAHLDPLLDRPLLQLFFPDNGETGLLDQTRYAQPALFALQVALTRLWRSWGVIPEAVLGHSLGEYAAAWAAGVFDLAPACKLVATRAMLMDRLPPDGAMVAVFADEATVRRALSGSGTALTVAAVNGPEEVVISGARDALEPCLARLEREGIRARPLKVSQAFHSPWLDPILDPLEAAAAAVPTRAPDRMLVSNLSGKAVRPGELDGRYWRRHAREPVAFFPGLQTLLAAGFDHFVEIGPGSTLTGLGMRSGAPQTVRWLPTLKPGRPDQEQFLETLGQLYVGGQPLERATPAGHGVRRKVGLPTYPFERQRYWVEAADGGLERDAATSIPGTPPVHPLLGHRFPVALREAIFQQRLSVRAPAYLADHRVFDRAILPGAAYLEMALAAGRELLRSASQRSGSEFADPAAIEPHSFQLEDVVLQEPLPLPEEDRVLVQTIAAPIDDDVCQVQISSRPVQDDGTWVTHASGRVRRAAAQGSTAREGTNPQGTALPAPPLDIDAIKARLVPEASLEAYYGLMQARGLEYGPTFRGLAGLWHGNREVLAKIELPDAVETRGYRLHPALLDACLQSFGRALDQKPDDPRTYLPIGLDRLTVHAPADRVVWCHARLREGQDTATVSADLDLYDPSGALLASLEGFTARQVDRAALTRDAGDRVGDMFYEVAWHLHPLPAESATASPDYLPHPSELQAPLVSALDAWGAEVQLERYQALFVELESISIDFVRQALTGLGWTPALETVVQPAALATQLGIAPSHRRLFDRMLEMLGEAGFLVPVPDGWQVVEPIAGSDGIDPSARLQSLRDRFPAGDAEIDLLARCGPRLAEVIQGRLDPVQLLFPGGSLTNLERLYQDSPPSIVFNRLVRKAVADAVARLPAGRKLRVLEIGAGTGGTTSYVLPVLPKDRTDYLFTDVSPLFLVAAREKFADHPFVRYGLLDVEKRPAEQGLEAQQFDLVLAVNVLHATADLARTLDHVQALMAPGALLVQVENTGRQRWIDLVFGLTAGWWHYTDTDLRPDHPLISEAQWRALLERSGFDMPRAVPEAGPGEAPPQQALLLAQKPLTAITEAATADTWMLFSDGVVGPGLAARLEHRGSRVLQVLPGDGFLEETSDRYRVNPANPEDFQRLFTSIAPPLRGVVFLWGLSMQTSDDTPSSALEAMLEQTCGGLLHLTQALAGLTGLETPRLLIATRGAQAVEASTGLPQAVEPSSGGSQPAEPAAAVSQASQSVLWGFARAVISEQPGLKCQVVDVDPAEAADVTPALEREVLDPDGEGQVAWRGDTRRVARLERRSVPALPTPAAFRPDASYLIVGGLGGLGLAVAERMIDLGARTLVLSGRHEANTAALEKIADLEARGATLRILPADVSDEVQVEALLAAIRAQLPPLRGIIHSAGVLDDGVLVQQRWERFRYVMGPKVLGAWNLHRLSRGLELDHFILFSSVSALFGSPGQGNHAAASAFEDGLASYRRARGLPGLSINWGAWGGIGAVVKDERAIDALMTRRGMGLIEPRDGIEAFERLLAVDRPQVAVMVVDWPRLLQRLSGSGHAAFFGALAPRTGPRKTGAPAKSGLTGWLARLRSTPSATRKTTLRTFVRDQAARVLGLEPTHPLNEQQPLNELGLDSLMAVELRNTLSAATERSLPATLVFNYPTVEALTEHLARDLRIDEDPIDAVAPSATPPATARPEPPELDALSEPIAIVGMGCRFPGDVNDPEAYWTLLERGIDAVTEVPASRWDIDAYYDPDPDLPGRMNTRYGAFLRDVDRFDARFFGIAPREAVSMDPQQRLLLEVAWEALEHAGIAPTALAGSQTGVFVGMSTKDYGTFFDDDQRIDVYMATGNAPAVAAGRLSYVLGVHGPCFPVDTACSSSLVAVHLACQSLRRGESRMALVGGVNLILTPKSTLALSRLRMLAPDGHCKTFDAAADGFVRGEGCGVVVLKRLSDARADGDRVLAVIRGSAVNQDGRSSGLTAPNGPAQEAVIRQALADARVAPEAVSYLEAHGTGTALGDPIEVMAASNVLCQRRDAAHPLVIGSVKTNFGHLEAAAGMAGLFKVILALQHRALPAHLHFQDPTPHIPWKDLPILVPTRLRPWPSEGPRIAGLSSFGFGGTNAHLILEESLETDPVSADAAAPLEALETSPHPVSDDSATPEALQTGAHPASDASKHSSPRLRASAGDLLLLTENETSTDTPAISGQARKTPDTLHLLPISARSEPALKTLCQRFAHHLRSHPRLRLADIAHTAQVGRAHLPHRVAVLAATPAEAAEKLEAFCIDASPPGLTTGVASSDHPRVAFLFTGQGAQYPGMGRTLYQTERVFREALDECDALLRPWMDRPLLEVLFSTDTASSPRNDPDSPNPRNDAEGSSLLDDTTYTQPALFSLQVALTRLWQSWGIAPQAVLGHSVGEFAAAWAAGALDLPSALELIAGRARLMGRLPPGGAMAAVFTDDRTVRQALEAQRGRIAIAALNGPGEVVISGARDAVDDALSRLEAQGIRGRRLKVSHAFHSPLVDPMLDAFEQLAGKIPHRSPTLDLVSNLTGQVLGEHALDAVYWRRHAREPVAFQAGLETLLRRGIEHFVEIGPAPVLLGMGMRIAGDGVGVWVPSIGAGTNDRTRMLSGLGRLYVHGHDVRWSALHVDPVRRVTLPTYPFERERYWVDVGPSERLPSASTPDGLERHPLLGRRVPSAGREALFDTALGALSPAWLGDHRVSGVPIVPGAAYVELGLAAAAALSPIPDPPDDRSMVVEDLVFQTPLRLKEAAHTAVQTVATRQDDGRIAFQVLSASPDPESPWTLHATGILRQRELPAGDADTAIDLDAVKARCPLQVSADPHYQGFLRRGLEYGPSFQGLEALWRGNREVLARVALPELVDDTGYIVHPALLDACLQSLAGALEEGQGEGTTYLPHSLSRLTLVHRPGRQVWVRAVLRAGSDTGVATADLWIHDPQGRLLLSIDGFAARPVALQALRGATDAVDALCYEVEWRPQAPGTTDAPQSLPSPSAIADGLRPVLPALFDRYALQTYRPLFHDLEALSLRYVRRAFLGTGWDPRPGDPITLDRFMRDFGILPTYRRLAARLFGMLVDDGALVPDADGWRVAEPLQAEDPQPAMEALLERYPACDAEIEILMRCGPRLADVLQGRQDHFQLLFPGGSIRTLERLYQESPFSQVFNQLAQDAVRTAMERLPAGRRVRVLEVGAGTGGTTAYVLPVLPADRVEYRFTDVSTLFVAAAEQKFAAWPFMRYQVLDIEQAPEKSGLEPGSFDLVIVVNMLHATRDLRETLRHLRRFMAPDALLLLIENSGQMRWIDLTFGLTDGWWRFTDLELRPSHALLAGQRWLELLQEEGFQDARAVPDLTDDVTGIPQTLFLARSPKASEAMAATADAGATPDAWLIFADGPIGEALAGALERQGRQPILIAPSLVTVEPSPVTVEHAPASVEHAPVTVEHSPVTVEHSPVTVEHSPVTVEHSPASVEHAPASVGPSPASVEPSPASVEHAPASVGHAPASVEHAPASVEHAPASVGPSPASVGHAPASVEHAPASVGHAPASVGPSPASVEHAPASVEHAPASVAHTADRLEVDSLSPPAFHALLREVTGRIGRPVTGVVYLWGLETEVPASRPDTGLEDALALGCGGLLHLTQALAVVDPLDMPGLLVVTRGAQPAGTGEGAAVPDPAQAVLWGLCRAIRTELPALRCATVDLDPTSTGDAVAEILDAVNAADLEAEAAYRSGIRHLARLTRVSRPRPSAGTDTARCAFQADASYLIVGGLGGLGLAVAEWMVDRGARCLVLAGRRGPDATALERIRGLEARGAALDVQSVDVSRADQVDALFAHIRQALPPLRGVIHSAGVLDDGVLLQQRWERFRTVLGPKALGAWHLHRCTEHLALDHFILFSSASGLFGSPGQANHAAANAFEDALAHHRRARGLPGLSIDWGAWGQIGAVVKDTRDVTGGMTRRGIGLISPAEGLEALERAILEQRVQMAVMAVDWSKLLKHSVGGGNAAFFSALTGTGRRETPAGGQKRSADWLPALQAVAPGNRRDLLRTRIREQVQRVMGLDQARGLDDRQPLNELGMDSLMAVELRNRLGAATGRTYSATLLFTYPTIDALTDCLSREIALEQLDTLEPGLPSTRISSTSARPSGSTPETADPSAPVSPTAARPPGSTPQSADPSASMSSAQAWPSGSTPESAARSAFTSSARSTETMAPGAAVDPDAIAIIGMSCRFPGTADSPEAFWSLLEQGVDAIREVPADRWDVDACYDPDPDRPGRMNTRHGAFLEGVDRFDARFFGISPREAVSMDPQQRLLLEVSWEALERAGQAAGSPSLHRTGVFVGLSGGDYGTLFEEEADIDVFLASGNAPSVAAGRLAYTLGLNGPAMVVDTACSSSLVALHLAVRSLRQGECLLALAGGANLILTPRGSLALSRLKVLSPDGRCKTFDASANGFVRGEGCGMVVLKRLVDAQADGDRVLAVIRGSAVNQDGRSSGLTVPNGLAQEEVLRLALADARVTPESVQYLEAFGAGSALGDPIELIAAGAVFAPNRTADAPLVVGSVKTNFGHLEAAAGIAGLIKVVLSLQHRQVPPHLHFHDPSPHIPWAELPVTVPTTLRPWPASSGPRRAGISSFGFSGTNAHVILEEAPLTGIETPVPVAPMDNVPLSAASASTPWDIAPLSAASPSALKTLCRHLADHLQAHPDVRLADLCRTLQVGRSHLAHRLAIVAEDTGSAARLLKAAASGDTAPGIIRQLEAHTQPRIAFLFGGEAMLSRALVRTSFGPLLEHAPAFRETLLDCQARLRDRLDIPLLELLFSSDATPDRLVDPTWGHPALFALQVALARLWQSWGIQPRTVLGYGLGEITAATVAGVLDLDSGLELVTSRARLLAGLPRNGGMAAISADEDAVRQCLREAGGPVSVAAITGPADVVISGDHEALHRSLALLRARGLEGRILEGALPLHSPLVDPILDRLEQVADTLSVRRPDLGWISTLTGQPIGNTTIDADHWRRQAREAVALDAAMTSLAATGGGYVVEIDAAAGLFSSPHSSALHRTGDMQWLTSIEPERPTPAPLLESLGRLYCGGAQIHWAAVQQGRSGRTIDLPTYPFERQRYWISRTAAPRPADTVTPPPEHHSATVSIRPGDNGTPSTRPDYSARPSALLSLSPKFVPGSPPSPPTPPPSSGAGLSDPASPAPGLGGGGVRGWGRKPHPGVDLRGGGKDSGTGTGTGTGMGSDTVQGDAVLSTTHPPLPVPATQTNGAASINGAATGAVNALSLAADTRGTFDGLSLHPTSVRPPGPGEVQIRVRAAGLNFRDVLDVLGLIPGEPGPMGGECAGEIVAVGEGVHDFRPGQGVVTLAPGCFSTLVTAPAILVAPKPDHLSFEEAATIPVAFLTAHYGLHTLARVATGDRVLIHAAAGGVGLAAVQLALLAGAVVYGTAGNEEKRAFLAARGVAAQMSSRTLDFALEVQRLTDGRGVDIVLNSLAGASIARSLETLRPGGRFLEIGKTDIWTPQRVAAMRSDIAYIPYDLIAEIVGNPAWIGDQLRALMRDFDAKRLHPLPVTPFPIPDAASAFRHMAQARHIGKIVLTVPLNLAVPAALDPSDQVTEVISLLEQLKATPPAQRLDLLIEQLGTMIARVMGLTRDQIPDPRQPLNELGLDSLLAVELRNALATAVGRSFPVTLLFNYPTMEALADFLLREVFGPDLAPPPVPSPPALDIAQVEAHLDDMSEDELAAFLLDELNSLQQRTPR